MLLLMSWRHGAYIMRLLWLDVLLRLNLPIWGLKGQTYDGASNVAGKHLGTANTATSTICTLSSTMCQFGHTSFLGLLCCAKCTLLDTWPWAVWTLAHFLGSLAYLKTSLKPLLQLKGKGPAVSIRPLCPTRWTVRSPAIRCFVMVQNALDEMVASHSQGGGCTCLTATGCCCSGTSACFRCDQWTRCSECISLEKHSDNEGWHCLQSPLSKTVWNLKINTKHILSFRRQRTSVICLFSSLFHHAHRGPW